MVERAVRLPMAATATVEAAAPRALLDLIAEVMDASFELVGEGVVMGTMPGYVRQLGIENARYLQGRYIHREGDGGALAALTACNFLSRVTGTRFAITAGAQDHAAKRLFDCEFAEAFADKSDFAKAMICSLHRAVYEGQANGLLEDPGRDGFRVELGSRILFGGSHCDFHVESISDRPHEADAEYPMADPASARPADVDEFYASILVAFIEYLCRVLPADQVRVLLADCADRVGSRIDASDADSAHELVLRLLTRSWRDASHDDAKVTVTSCPFARTIRGAAKGYPDLRDAVRTAACGTCTAVLQGAVEKQHPGVLVDRQECLVYGADQCVFRIEEAT